MNGSTFDRFSQAVGGRSRRVARRAALGAATVAAAGWLAAPPASHAKKKRKKKKRCPKCPICPPAGPFCAGKDHCQEDASCQAEGAAQGCSCYLRADNLTSICGRIAFFPADCASCTGGYVCVVLSGLCADGVACVIACPDPR